MYFWRIEALKAQLRRGQLDQRQAFGYVLATFLLYAAVSEVPDFWNGETEPAHGLDWLAYAGHLLLLGAGTCWAFRANGSRLGADFAARYLAIGWVVGIRFVALFLALALGALLLLIATGVATGVIGEPSDATLDWGVFLLGLTGEAVFYWRVAHHIRDVATTDVATSGAVRAPG